MVSNPLVLFAQPSFPAKDLKELVAYAKANPGKVSAGVSGMSHQLTARMLNSRRRYSRSRRCRIGAPRPR